MTSDHANDNEWINDLFAANACDWTPASVHHAFVLYAPVSCDPEASKRCASVLSDAELQRADRFVTEDARAHFKQRRAFRRYCGAFALGSPRSLSQIDFQETENGRPYLPELPGFRFSFSSCRFGFLGSWSATHSIGVDIEDQTKNLEAIELAQQFFTETEAKVVKELSGPARFRAFFQLWTLKEAALKSIGQGLPYGLDAFEFDLVPNLRIVNVRSDHDGPERFNAYVIEGTNSCAAVVTRSLA